MRIVKIVAVYQLSCAVIVGRENSVKNRIPIRHAYRKQNSRPIKQVVYMNLIVVFVVEKRNFMPAVYAELQCRVKKL